ncbi:MAG: hypothetical protein R3E83_18975 [Burkholderiaceae bacterium]
MTFFLAISTAMIRLAAACCATAILALLLARPAFAQVEPIFVVDCPGRQCPDAAAVTAIEQDALDARRRQA